ncbi:MAG: mechanosensitive ion channel family protein [Stellaceae bacterium]
MIARSNTFRALALVLALSPLLAGGPARAQTPEPAAQPAAAAPAQAPVAEKPAAPPAVSTEQLQQLLDTIQIPAERQRLIGELQALIAAQNAIEQKQSQSGLKVFFGGVSEEAKGLADEILEAAQVVVDAPRLVGYFRYQTSNEEARARWIAVAKELAIVFGLGILADWLAWFLLRVPERRLRARAGKEAAQQLMFLAAGAVIEALPILVFAAVAFIVLPLTQPNFATDQVARTLIEAYLWSRVIVTVARVLLLSPSALALYPLGEETRHYLYIWARRFTNWTVYGLAAAACAWWLSAPGAIYAVLLRIVVLVLGVLAVVFVLQNRKPVADWLRGDPAEEAARSPGWKLFRYRLAEVWHILALIYILGTFGVFSLHIEGGILFLLRSTVVSVVLVLTAALAVQFIHRAVRRGFAISPELKTRFPTLEARTNRYIPALTLAVSVAVYVLAAIALLQAWGVDAFAWLQATASSRAAGSLASVAVALLAALVAWEVFISLLERHMQRLESDSRKRARAETFFPFLRLVVVVILGVILGFVVLDALGISLGPLLAGEGVFGLVAGLGSQAIIKDVMTSIAVLVDDTIAVGDYIDVGNGREGTVEAIKLRTIKLLTPQGGIMTVPFSEAHVITNLSKDASFYVANISVSYFEDCNRAIALLKETAETMRQEPAYKRVILAPLEIFGLDRFEPGAYIIQARLKTQRAKHLATGREFNRRVKEAFDHHHIAMRSDLLAPVSLPDKSPPPVAPKKKK